MTRMDRKTREALRDRREYLWEKYDWAPPETWPDEEDRREFEQISGRLDADWERRLRRREVRKAKRLAQGREWPEGSDRRLSGEDLSGML